MSIQHIVGLFFFLCFFNLSTSSTEDLNYYNACLSCLAAGAAYDFCVIVPEMEPGKCCNTMVSAVDYCDPIYTWCTYSYTGNAKYWMCPIAPSCDVTVSISDEKWITETLGLIDGEVCIHRLKYDVVHIGDVILDLQTAAQSQTFTYSDMTGYIEKDVKVRFSSSSSFIQVYYEQSYLEKAPAAAMPAMTLGETYTLPITDPYMTILVVSFGGESSYTLEYGRIDERAYGRGESEAGAVDLLMAWSIAIALTACLLI